MKRLLLLGLLAASVLAPIASAHIVILHDPDGDGECQYTVIGRRDLAPHAAGSMDGCGTIYHPWTLP